VTKPKNIFEHEWVSFSGGGPLDLEPTYWQECTRCGLVEGDVDSHGKVTWQKDNSNHVYKRCPKCKPKAATT